MDTINLHLDSDNELLFKVTVEGSREAETTCRLMLEKDDFSYMFTGGVSADGEEGGPGDAARLCVELNLRGMGIWT